MSQDLGNACAGLDDATLDELRAIAAVQADAAGLMMKLASWAGDKAADVLGTLPGDWQARITDATDLALRESYRIAFAAQPDRESATVVQRALSWADGERWHQVATGITGALGGLGGIATTLLDLPVTTTLILRSIQQIAAGYGEDLSDEAVRAACVGVFALGGPTNEDDDADVGLVGARLALTGKSVAEVMRLALPRLGIVVGEKALAQATPLLGAVAGAAINPTFTGYYQSMAHVHFRLRRLEREGDPEQLRACFGRIVHLRRSADI